MANEKNTADPLDLPSPEVASKSPGESGSKTDAALSEGTTSSVSVADAAPQDQAQEGAQEGVQEGSQESVAESAPASAASPSDHVAGQEPFGQNNQMYGSQGSNLPNAAYAPQNMQQGAPYFDGQPQGGLYPSQPHQVWGQQGQYYNPAMGSGSMPPAGGYPPHMQPSPQGYPMPPYNQFAGAPVPPNAMPNGAFGAPQASFGQGSPSGLGAPSVPLGQAPNFEHYQGMGQSQHQGNGGQTDLSNLPLLVKSADGRIFVQRPKGQGQANGGSSTVGQAGTTPSGTNTSGSNAAASPAGSASAATTVGGANSATGAAQAPTNSAPSASVGTGTGASAQSANAQVGAAGAASAAGVNGSGTKGVTGTTGATGAASAAGTSGGFGAPSSQSTQGATGFGGQHGGNAANSGAAPFVYEPPKNYPTQGYVKSAHTEKWYDNLGIHIFFVCLISLVLLIPASFFSWVLDDRRDNQRYAIRTMTEAWGGEQMLADPELIIPVLESEEIEIREGVRSKVRKDYRYIRPKYTKTDLKLVSEKRYKGNYEASLYTVQVDQSGYFNVDDGFELINSEANIEMMEQNEIRLAISISDNKGIDEIKSIEVGGTKFEAVPSDEFNGFEVRVPSTLLYSNQKLDFKFSYMVRGSQSIKFFSLSQVSELNIDAQGAIPNFMGSFLPREREVNLEDHSFTAKYYQNNLATGQAMVSANEFSDDQSHIIVGLDEDADSYVMILRLTKYVLLVIAMTFVTVLAFEIVSHHLISLVQYVVIGIALIMFYLVLLALSEHIAFELAYIVGTLVLSSMISLYVKAAFNSKKHAVCLLLMLLAMYAVLYAIVHIEAYALLVGTIILVIMLGIVMYITRHINQKGNGIKSF